MRLARRGAALLAPSQERSRERVRRAGLSGLAAVGAYGVGVLVVVVTVPITLPYLGTERYGLWMTLTSFIVLLNLVDFGIGNSLVNSVAEADGRDDLDAAKRHVSTAFFLLVALAAVLAVVFVLVYPLIHWDAVFNVSSSQAADEAGPAAAVLAGVLFLGLPLNIVQRAQSGQQQGFRSSVWNAGGSLLGLAGICIAVALNAGLPWLAGVYAAGPLLATAVNNLYWFGRIRPQLRPQLASVSRSAARALVRLGFSLFVLNLAWGVTNLTDNIVIAQVLGADSVAGYAVAWKLFTLISVPAGLVLLPLWPAYAEAATRGDMDWVRLTFRRSMRLVAAVVIPASALFVLLGREVIQVWTGSAVHPSFALMCALGVWTVIYGLSMAASVMLTGLRAMRLQVTTWGLAALVNVPLSVVLASALGVEGAILGSLAAVVAFVTVPYCVAVPRILGSRDRVGPQLAPDPSAPRPSVH